MLLNEIQVSNVRNLENIEIEPGQAINLFIGENGAGKSSFLEAIHILSTGRSFRSRDISKVIKLGTPKLNTFCRGVSALDRRECRVGISRSRSGDSHVRVDGENIRRISELAAHFPLQLISPDSIELVLGGSKVRRQYIDWGVFHVKPSQIKLWRQCDRLIRQRNRVLREGVDTKQLAAWDRSLIPAAQQLTEARQDYLSDLLIVLREVVSEFFESDTLSFNFSNGWGSNHSLTEALMMNMTRDIRAGFSHVGPHRAGFILKVFGKPAEHVCSRGQLKVLMCCLKLAQGIHLTAVTRKRCIFLIDDLAAELDKRHRRKLIKLLSTHNFQSFITTIEKQLWLEILPDNKEEIALFHVEHGKIHPF